MTPQLAASVIEEVARERGLEVGPIVDAFDARIQSIVDNWPVAVYGARALALGLPHPPPLKRIVEECLGLGDGDHDADSAREWE